LLGLRVGLSDIAALGAQTAILVIVAMAATVASGFVFARWNGRTAGFGALVGVGTAVCGASATLDRAWLAAHCNRARHDRGDFRRGDGWAGADAICVSAASSGWLPITSSEWMSCFQIK
jgi:integral membrane protein